MALLTVIGRGVRIRGRIQGDGDLAIEGHVEGEVAVSGELVVESAGLVGANVTARVIVVRGAVRGDLTAEDVVRLEEGARVVGDIRAPRIAITRGALVKGLVETGAPGKREAAPRAKARAETPAPAKVAAPAHRAVAPVAAAPARPAPTPAVRPAPAPARVATVETRPVESRAVEMRAPATRSSAPSTPSVLAGAAPAPAQAVSKGPPPPTVPALKKGAKAALKKKSQ